ncbi:sporulation integral membrane protein YlbJ [Thermaerobacter marianensis DSM 12885]|uniref:Sporulation integral membrane protein YlbJ n=1 Tax=Thermaerobacter marianensis (strain ATCC 700841 / DSM 12885 / JCM 10246 / 7p75a) TaxID=644966 RepID=E6SJC2_THEM7|nr:sporulation integral membrane protein YlbJ [Thermaerobacter marianensis DSM 12885]
MRESPLTHLLVAAVVGLVLAMVVYPETAFSAAVAGLKVWWDIVFPALLPFFIGAQILMALGVVHFMGVMMEPFMRPLFNVPGAGAFVVAVGLASGYPLGAVITARMRQQGLLSKTEAERLMSFSNTADPLFMAGAVAVGMFGTAAVAGPIMAAHYIGALLTGLALRFWRAGRDRSPALGGREGWLLGRAWRAMVDARREDGRPFGQVLGDAVRDSVNTLLLVGGLIILMSVVIQVLGRAGILHALGGLFLLVLHPLGLDPSLTRSLISGLFELTLGTQAAAQAPAPLADRLIVAGAVIAWSGLSVHAQVAAIVQGTDLHIGPYIAARLFHAVATGAVTVLWLAWFPVAAPAFLPATAWAAPGPAAWLARLAAATVHFLLAVGGLATVAAVTQLLRWRPAAGR